MRKDMPFILRRAPGSWPGASRFHDARADQPVKLRKLAVQVRIALFEKLVLMAGAHAAAGALAVTLVKPVHDIHAFDNSAEWREAVAILALHAVVCADVDLRGARAGT